MNRIQKKTKKKLHFKKNELAPPPALPVGALVVFTDGSCLNNGSPSATGGFACVWPYNQELTGAWPLKDGTVPTNNRAEFHAFLKACRDADTLDTDQQYVASKRTLHVFTDSELLVKTVVSYIPQWRKKGWVKKDGSPVMNLDLCQAIAAACDNRAIKMEHVRAHTAGTDPASVLNRQADELASRACRSQQIVK